MNEKLQQGQNISAGFWLLMLVNNVIIFILVLLLQGNSVNNVERQKCSLAFLKSKAVTDDAFNAC